MRAYLLALADYGPPRRAALASDPPPDRGVSDLARYHEAALGLADVLTGVFLLSCA